MFASNLPASAYSAYRTTTFKFNKCPPAQKLPNHRHASRDMKKETFKHFPAMPCRTPSPPTLRRRVCYPLGPLAYNGFLEATAAQSICLSPLRVSPPSQHVYRGQRSGEGHVVEGEGGAAGGGGVLISCIAIEPRISTKQCTEHAGLSPARQTSRAPRSKRREVCGLAYGRQLRMCLHFG